MSAPFGHEQFHDDDVEPVSPVFTKYWGKLSAANAVPPKRRVMHLDYETFSRADLRKTGASRYSRDPSTEILMLAWGWSDGEVNLWVPAEGEPMPEELRAAMRDPSVTLAAWNAPFEMAITWNVLGMDVPIERWLDVMALAYTLSLPGKLSTCGKVIGLPEEKQKLARGTALVRRFCMPRKPSKHKPWDRSTMLTDPEEWEEFKEYCRQDVVAERLIYRRIKKWQMPDHEWRLWHLDQKINNAGIPINSRAVAAAVRLAKATIDRDMTEMRKITGLVNPNSGAQLLPWLREHGYPYMDLKKGHVERAAKAAKQELEEVEGLLAGLDHLPAPLPAYFRARYVGPKATLNRVLELRLQVSKASVKKYDALLAATDDDDVLRGGHQFAGAGRTWRWSGRRFQPQNLSKPSKAMEKFILAMAPDHLTGAERVKAGFLILVRDIESLSVEEFWAKYDGSGKPGINTMEALVAAVRPMVQAPEGHELVDADLSAIENVGLGWLADDDKILRVFRNGLDPYIDFAVDMFNMPYDEIAAIVNAGDKTMRTTAKPGVLGCGYMLGAGDQRENQQTGEIEATGLLGYAWGMYVPLTPEMSKLSVDTFRAKFEDVVKFWYDLDKACRRAIKTGEPQVCGYLEIDISRPFMRIKLPSGRYLHYVRPRLEDRKMPWKDRAGNAVYKKSITYENMENGQWRRVTTHPGKLTENVVQATARDFLAYGMTLADARGHDIRMHVHDQAVAVSRISRAGRDLTSLIECLTACPPWANEKLATALKAAGWTTPIFLKD